MTPQPPADVRPDGPVNRRSIGSSLRPVPTTKVMGPTRRGFSASGMFGGGMTAVLVGLGMYVILAILGEPAIGSLALAPGLVLGGYLFVVAERRRARDARVRSVQKAIARQLSLQHHGLIEADARGWTGGWIGTPLVLNLHYPAEVNNNSDRWAIEVAEVAKLQLGIGYVVGRHNARHRRLTLRDPRLSSHTAKPTQDEVSVGAVDALPTKIDRPRPAVDFGRDFLVPLGVDGSGTTVAWDLRSPRSHMLIIGGAGTGKQVLCTGIAMEVATRGWPVWIVDFRRVDLLGLRDWPNAQIVGSSLEDQVVIVNQAWRELESRISLVDSGTDRDSLEPLVVIVHPFRDFAVAVNEWSERAGMSRSGSSVLFERFNDLLRHGHSVNVFLVLSVSRADDELVGQQFRDSFGAVVALGRIEQDTSKRQNQLWKTVESSDSSSFVPGRATVQLGDAPPLQVQCYWTPDPREAQRSGNSEDQRIVDYMRPPAAHHPPLYVQRHATHGGGATVDPAAAWEAAMTAELQESRSAGGAEGGLAAWSRSTPIRRSATPQIPASKSTSGWSEVIMVSQLAPGNLARLDDENGWVIIEKVEAVTDPTKIRIQWRGNDGAGSVEVSRTLTVRIRHMTDGIY